MVDPLVFVPRRRPSRRRFYLAALLLAGAVPVLQTAACGSSTPCASGDDCPSQSEAFQFDTLCADPSACPVTGSAVRTSGLTADTVGFLIDQGAGSVTIPIATIAPPGPGGSYEEDVVVQVLVAASDAPATVMNVQFCTPTCNTAEVTQVPLTNDYAWMEVGSGTAGTTTAFPEGSTLVLSGSGIDVADIRSQVSYVEVQQPSSGGCDCSGNAGVSGGVSVGSK
jgi:hypothetical protein